MAGQTFYMTNTQDASLTNAGVLANTTGALTTVSVGTKIGQITGFGQWSYANNNTLFTPLASLPTVANGKGWLLDASILNLKGQQIPGTATWSVTFRGQVSVGGSATVDSYLVYYLYNTISGQYTFLGSQVKSGGTWGTSASNHSIAAATIATFPGMLNFGNADTLYVEPWFDVTANSTGNNNAVLQLALSSSNTQGNANSMQFAVSQVQAIPTPKPTGSGFYRNRRSHRERIAA